MILSRLNSFITKEIISLQKETNLKLETTDYQGARFKVTMETTKYMGLLCHFGNNSLSWELYSAEISFDIH
jgi:hypothetical protein